MQFYKHLPLLLFMILLSSCASIQANYYNQTINSWRGADINTLLKKWGRPAKKLNTLSGSTVYVYKKQEFRNPESLTSPAVGVNYRPGGTPIVTTTRPTNWNNGLTLFCIAAFEVNKEGTIIDVQTQGNNCFADSEFMNRMKNPD